MVTCSAGAFLFILFHFDITSLSPLTHPSVPVTTARAGCNSRLDPTATEAGYTSDWYDRMVELPANKVSSIRTHMQVYCVVRSNAV
jgi:hypothetical protein